MGIFDSFTGGATAGAARDSSTAQWSALQDALNVTRDRYAQGRQDLQEARQQFNPIYNIGVQQLAGLPMYANALGVNGQQGRDAAMTAFRDYNPGYQYQQDQAQEQLKRQAAAVGGGALGGNAWTALQDRAQNIANTSFNDWVNQIANLDARYRQTGLGAALGGAGGNYQAAAAMAGLGQTEASNEAQYNMGTANQIAQNAMRAGQAADQGNANMWSAATNAFSGLMGTPGGANGIIKGIGSFFGA